MHHNKKVWLATIVLAMVAALALAGCGSSASQTPQAAAPAAQPAAATSTADAALEKIKAKGELVVGTAPFYAPFESTDEKTKQIEGFDVDLMNAVAAKMGVKPTFKPADWQALLGGLGKGDFDAVFSAMSKKEAAAGNVAFSDVYYQLADVIVVKKGNPKSIDGTATLAGKVVGVQLASGDEQIADKLKGSIKFKDVKKYKLTQDALNDLKVGRIDAVLAGREFIADLSKTDPSYQIVGQPLETADLVAVFPKGNDGVAAAFNKAFAEVKADGTYDQLVAKWLTVK